MRGYQIFVVLVCFLLLSALVVSAQVKYLAGVVKDKHSDEPIPFASVFFKIRGSGVSTDSAGRFNIRLNSFPFGDTLVITSVGYKNTLIPLNVAKDSSVFNAKMEVLPTQKEIVVKTKYNRSLWFWQKIIANKNKHNKRFWDNYAYEVYNKLEVDLNNVNIDKLSDNKLLKPFSFVLMYVDSTSEDDPYLPVYLTETLSDYYFQKEPQRIRENIKAAKTNGLENESVIKYIGGMYQNINVYENFLNIFDKQFVSPLHDNGDRYYNFKLLDTQYLYNKRLIHLRFTPKQEGTYTFEGDCWVNDASFAIQKITLRPAAEANINFIKGLSLIQEFKPINDTTWFVCKDRFVIDFVPLGYEKLGLKGRKTTTYKNILFNSKEVTEAIHKNTLAEEVNMIPDFTNKTDSFWRVNRHDTLDKNEQTVYKVIDTLENNPVFKRYRNTLDFLTTGTKHIGNLRIGPWYYWLSTNSWEGARVRFDLASNFGFSKKWYWHGYGAYGFGDNNFKGKAEVKYMFGRRPWSYITASYVNDLDNGQKYYDQIGTDNIFSVAFRRSGIPVKFQEIREAKLEYYTESSKGFAIGLEVGNIRYNPLANLPGKSYFENPVGAALNSFETSVRLRYAFLEEFIEDNFLRISFGSTKPIVEIKYTKGWSGVLNSSYDYGKVTFTFSDRLKLGTYGKAYYNIFGGKIFGTLPYDFLEVHPGNEMFYYNKHAFNLMNRYEYLSDRYAGFIVEHNIGIGLFRYIPLTRKWKFRQFWSAKGVVGNLSEENQKLNFVGNHSFKTLNNDWYMEVGTGVDNIFKFFRVDLIWRVLPKNLSANMQMSRNFGVYGSFRFSL